MFSYECFLEMFSIDWLEYMKRNKYFHWCHNVGEFIFTLCVNVKSVLGWVQDCLIQTESDHMMDVFILWQENSVFVRNCIVLTKTMQMVWGIVLLRCSIVVIMWSVLENQALFSKLYLGNCKKLSSCIFLPI